MHYANFFQNFIIMNNGFILRTLQERPQETVSDIVSLGHTIPAPSNPWVVFFFLFPNNLAFLEPKTICLRA